MLQHSDDEWSAVSHSYLFQHLLPRRREILKYIHEWRKAEMIHDYNHTNNEKFSPIKKRMEEICKFWSTKFISSDTFKNPLIIVQEIMKIILEFLNEFSFLFTFVNSQNGDAYNSKNVQSASESNNSESEGDNHLLYFLWKDNYSNRVPKEWRDFLEKCSDMHLIELMNYTQQEEDYNEVHLNNIIQLYSSDKMPLSFRRFVLGCKLLRFHKVILPNVKEIVQYLKTEETTKDCINDSNTSTTNFQLSSCEWQNTELSRHMSPKKIHEIERLAEFISTFSHHTFPSKMSHNKYDEIMHCSIPTILDIGSGKGYLSHVLFAKYGLNVIAIDRNDHLVQKIQEKSKKFEKSTKVLPNQKKQQKNQLKAISSHLECNREQLSKMVNQMLETTLSIQCDDDSIVGNNCIVGLHTCGDLTPILCDMYVNDVIYTKQNKSLIHSLVNVGCCYHKLTEKYRVRGGTDPCHDTVESSQVSTHFQGFPLTSFVEDYVTCNLKGFQLTRSGLILGCTENNIWSTNEGYGNEPPRKSPYKVQEYWKRNAFRCAMEYFLHEYVEKKEIPSTILRPVVYR